MYDLEKQNVGWVLLSGVIEMDRYPVYKEKITIRTWLSSYSRIRGIRENLIFDDQGFIIGRAKGFDVDTNLHVNNIRYLQWMIESMPKDITDNYDLSYIDGRFIAEALYGDTILSYSEMDVNDHSFAHTIKTKGNNKDCATAKTKWKERKNKNSTQ